MAPSTRQQSPEAVARREERRQAKREIVLRATLDIINEGDINPSMPKIVERSGIPERSVFRYFDDIADLTRQAIALARVDLSDIEGIATLGVGTRDERIDDIVTARLEILERVRFIGRVARMRVFLAPDLSDTLDAVLEMLRADLVGHFAPEFDVMSEADSARVLDALTVLLSFESYDVLRRRLERSPEQIADTWSKAITLLLP